MKKLPAEFTARMKRILGEEYEEYEKAVNAQSVRGYRVNTDKISVEDFLNTGEFSCERIPYVENGFYLENEKVGSHPYHHAGMIYIQEPGAMVPAECVETEKDWKILDMCAAPGGKSTQLKNKLGENGVLVSNEIIPSRCKILTGNIERLGLKNTVTTCLDTGRLSSLFPEVFDLVMVDAPCSGEGMFRKDDTALEEWSEENVLKCAQRQKEILENASLAVKNGGYIVYATCTFSLEENEMVIDSFLSRHPDFEIVPVSERVRKNTSPGLKFEGCQCENIDLAVRFYPHKGRGEGQFAAVLRSTKEKPRSENTEAFNKKTPNTKAPDKAVFDFLDSVLEKYDKSHVLVYKDSPVYFTPDFYVPKGIAFSCGVTIGEVKKNYILPHHQFFMAMGDSFKRKINISRDSEELRKYISGESFAADCENGWAAVTVDGCTVGGVKVVDGQAKNHYPKGLRGTLSL